MLYAIGQTGPKGEPSVSEQRVKNKYGGSRDKRENYSSKELVPKKNCTSEIWQYFGLKKEDVSQIQVLCKSYWKTVVTSRGNTIHLHSHLEHNHRELYEDFWKCNAKSTKTANEKPSNNKGDNHRSKFYKCNALRKNIKTSKGCYQTLFS